MYILVFPQVPKSSKKPVPMAAEPKSVPELTPSHRTSHTHHLTKHSTHTSSSLPHLPSPATKSTKHKSKSGMEHMETAPPPLPPRIHKLTPPKSATNTSRQPLPGNAQEPLHRVADHPHVPAGVREGPEQQGDDVWEEDKVRVTDGKYETQIQDQSMHINTVKSCTEHVHIVICRCRVGDCFSQSCSCDSSSW